MYKHCTVCIAVQLSIHSLHSDLCGMCLGRPSAAGLQRELFMSSLETNCELRLSSWEYLVHGLVSLGNDFTTVLAEHKYYSITGY